MENGKLCVFDRHFDVKSVHKTELLAVSFYLFIALKFSHAEFEL